MKTKILLFFLFSNLFGAASGHADGHHEAMNLNLMYVLPFVGMLMSIAVLPLVAHHFWEKNYGKISVFWALAFYLPFLLIEQKVDFAMR